MEFYDKELSEKITAEGRKQLRHVVDIVWNYMTESEEVPSTPLADKLIDDAIDSYEP